LNVPSIDENISPPALLSLTLGRILKKPTIDENNKLSFESTMIVKLSGVNTAYGEDELINILFETSQFINNPLTISL
jgi:hypothetical protein